MAKQERTQEIEAYARESVWNRFSTRVDLWKAQRADREMRKRLQKLRNNEQKGIWGGLSLDEIEAIDHAKKRPEVHDQFDRYRSDLVDFSQYMDDQVIIGGEPYAVSVIGRTLVNEEDNPYAIACCYHLSDEGVVLIPPRVFKGHVESKDDQLLTHWLEATDREQKHDIINQVMTGFRDAEPVARLQPKREYVRSHKYMDLKRVVKKVTGLE